MEQAAREGSIHMDGAGGALVVRGHRGILEYTERTLRLKMAGGALTVEGEGLTLERMDAEDIAVRGSIQCLRLTR